MKMNYSNLKGKALTNEKGEAFIKIRGKLNRVLFPKFPNSLGEDEDNPFGIVSWWIHSVMEGSVDNFKDSIVVKGNYYFNPDSDVSYTILAKETTDEKWGQQYELVHISEDLENPTVTQSKNFLRSILTDNQLKDLFETFSDPMPLIAAHDIESLKKVHGIGDYIASCIISRYEENKINSSIYIELADMDLTPNLINKLIRKYKNPDEVVKKVKNNPYQLTYDIEGLGFRSADSIALKAKIEPTSVERISAYVKYLLEEKKEDGCGYLTARELSDEIFSYFEGRANILRKIVKEDGTETNNISLALEKLKEKQIIIIEQNESSNERRIYLKDYYDLEKSISENLKRLKNSENKFVYDDWMENIKNLEKEQGFDFTEEQLEGIKLGLDNQVCFITGLAGSGKSTLVSGILASLKKYSFSQCALSGKAASRLQEVTGEDGKTIHRLLEFIPGSGFSRNENNPLEEDIIILDELSLVGEDIFIKLLQAIHSGTKLIMLGDMGQLESIGEGNLAYDIYKSKTIPVVELTKVQRQAQKSGIITMAHEVRNQKEFFEDDFEGKETYGELKDMHFFVSDSYENDRKKAIKIFKKLYESDIVNKDIMEIQLISPVKERGDSCVFNLNVDVQELINPKDSLEDFKIITVNVSKDKSFEIRENDKVMCIKNDYKTKAKNGSSCPIFNGWTGIVKEIKNGGENGIVVYFPLAKNEVIIKKEDIKKELTLGYACTCHKMQGSSAKVIIGVVNYTTPPKMLTSQLLYTLMTRAKKKCVIVGQNRAINKAIGTDFVSTKRTFLQELLEK